MVISEEVIERFTERVAEIQRAFDRRLVGEDLVRELQIRIRVAIGDIGEATAVALAEQLRGAE